MKKQKLFIAIILSFIFNNMNGQNFNPTVKLGDLTYRHSLNIEDVYKFQGNYFYYEFSVTKEVDFQAHHCGSPISGNTSMVLYNANGISLAYGGFNHICGEQGKALLKKANLPPGKYYLRSDFEESDGSIETTTECGRPQNPTGNTISNAINVGVKSSDFVYTDTQNTNDFTDEYRGQTTKDVFYSFTLTYPMDIKMSHCGSGVTDTYLHLLNSTGTRIAYNDDYSGNGACGNTRQSYLRVDNLPIGTYYVVSEGKSTNGDILTKIEGVKNVAISPSSNQNYILTITPTITSTSIDAFTENGALNTIQYFDGLGRPVQEIQVKASANEADLVTYQEYDDYGRESNTWLPATAIANNGAFISRNNYVGKALTTYANDPKTFTKLVYEDSPLNRVLEQYGPGQDWQNNGKAIRTTYLTNNNIYPCKFYAIGDDKKVINITRSSSIPNYESGELQVTQLTDEDGNISYEFKNKQKQVILTRQIAESGTHDTYYIYDSYGNLRTVLPPLAADNLNSGTWGEENIYLQQYAYLYKYDNRNRCIAKKLPGAEWIYYVYDKADRLIFTQDGEARAKEEWLFSIPDEFGRTVLTGTCKNTIGYETEQLNDRAIIAVWAGTGASYKGYNIPDLSLISPVKLLTAHYYDNYNFLSLPGFSTLGYNAPEAGLGTQRTGNCKTLLTGTYTAEENGGVEQLYASLYYDYRGRLIQTQSTNHLGGIESKYIGYNFSGQPLKSKIAHTAPGKNTQTEYYTYIYDHAGRLTKTEHQQGSSTGSRTVLEANTYDELGRLNTSKKGNLPASTYNYNVRSWLKSITGTLFNQNLYYNENYAGSKPQYNGNISAMSWKAGYEALRGYKFAYDGLSRLTKAEYMENGMTNNNYTIPTISYDKHGNITSLERWGKTSNGYGMVDNLILRYNGNQLSHITDAAVKLPDVTAGLNDFKDASPATSGEYSYNRNGAMTKDLNKGISYISYNSLNLPLGLTIDGVQHNYIYAADGTKLRVTRGSNITDYVGNKVYENGSLKRILVDGGYIENGIYHFYIQDHQGNNRIVATGSGTIVQRNHYYPFGMTLGEITASEQDKQSYKYNGKELDRKNGLNLYDYSARYMEPALGRFTTLDPMAEKYYSISPYAYCVNNPMRYVDPTGMSPEDDERRKAENRNFWEDITQIFHQLVEGFVYTIGFHTQQMYSENQAVQEDANQRRENTIEALHSINETLLSAVPGGEITYKALNDREISNGDYAWATVELTPIGKFKGIGKGASLWTKTQKLSAVENALVHWNKHGKEFTEFKNAKQYVEGTKNFLHNSPSGTLVKTRPNGDILKYYPKTNTFGVMDATGTPRTMFRPADGMKYWLKQ